MSFQNAYWIPVRSLLNHEIARIVYKKVYKKVKNKEILDFLNILRRSEKFFTYKIVDFVFRHSACLLIKIRVFENYIILMTFIKKSLI